VGVEQVGDARAGDHDAGVPVPGGQDAEPSCFEVEVGGVAAPGQGVDDDGDGELCALQPVGGVDPDLRGSGRGGEAEGLADLVGLVAVGDADGDVAGAERLAAGVALADPDCPAGKDAGGQGRSGGGCLAVGAGDVPGGQFVQSPARPRGHLQGRVLLADR